MILKILNWGEMMLKIFNWGSSDGAMSESTGLLPMWPKFDSHTWRQG